MRDYFKNFLSVNKICNKSSSQGICWAPDSVWKYYDKVTTTPGRFNDSAMVLNNGTFVMFYMPKASDCSYTETVGVDSASTLKECGHIIVDINGFKGPNNFGKDIYGMHLLSTGIKPWGVENDGWTNKCEFSTGINSGAGCAAKYLSGFVESTIPSNMEGYVGGTK